MKTTLSIICISMLSFSLTACVPAHRSEILKYRQVLDQGGSEVTPPGPDETLTLVTTMQLANAYNESLAIEGENYLQALIERRRIVMSFLPTVSLSSSYFFRDDALPSRELDPIGQPLGGGLITRGQDLRVDTDLRISPLGNLGTALAAGDNIESRKATLLDTQDRLLLDVARAYYEVVRSEKQIEVLKSAVELQSARLIDIRARNEVGFARVLDVNLSESQNAQTVSELIQAEILLRSNRALLEFLTAWPGAQSAKVESSLALPTQMPNVEELLNDAINRREDLIAAGKNVDAASYRVKAAYGQYFPSVSVNLANFLDRDSEPTERKWNAMIDISLPLFSAGVIEANVRQALSELRQSKLIYSQMKRRIKREIQVAHENWIGAERRFAQSEIRLNAGINASDAAEAMFSAGLATNLERLTAANELIATRLELTNADLERSLSYLDLKRMTGTLHELIGLTREAPEKEQDDA